jgi:hypothetical protein
MHPFKMLSLRHTRYWYECEVPRLLDAVGPACHMAEHRFHTFGSIKTHRALDRHNYIDQNRHGHCAHGYSMAIPWLFLSIHADPLLYKF